MTEVVHIPKGKLSAYIKFIWYSADYAPPARKERVLPAGSSQLILNLGADQFHHFKGTDYNQIKEYSHSIIAGVHSKFIFLDAFTRITTMGVVFRPAGIQAFFGVPADEFQNQIVSLGDLTNYDITAFRQRIIEATDLAEKFSIVKLFLLSLLESNFQPNCAIILAVGQMKNKNGMNSISEVADEIGYSRRRLSELFRSAVGIAPKRYARIQRFQHTLRAIREHMDSPPDWNRIALNSGYYDQAHFNRDFRSLSGLTPSEYFRHQTDESNHLHV